MTSNRRDRAHSALAQKAGATEESGPETVARGAGTRPASSPGGTGDLVPVKQLLRWEDDGGATFPNAYLT